MDILIGVGLLVALGFLSVFLLWDGGIWSGFILSGTMMIGALAGVVLIAVPRSILFRVPLTLQSIYQTPPIGKDKLSLDLAEMSMLARRSGLLALEPDSQNHPHPFVRESLSTIFNATTPESAQEIMEHRIHLQTQRMDEAVSILDTASGYAIGVGLLAALTWLAAIPIGLIPPENLLNIVAAAGAAPLLGIALSQLVLSPLAARTRYLGNQHLQEIELIKDGLVTIQSGGNPADLRQKLSKT